MAKYVSFSLYGNIKLVIAPPIKGVDRINDKNWKDDFRNAAMSWRYNVLDEKDCERAIFRDCDSRVNPREADAVSEWVESGMLAHSIYDCAAHTNCIIMPGICGLVGGIYSNIQEIYKKYRIHEYPKLNQPMVFFDIWFFYQKFIEPIVFSWMRHGYNQPFPLKTPMPSELGLHVGATVNEIWREEKLYLCLDKSGMFLSN